MGFFLTKKKKNKKKIKKLYFAHKSLKCAHPALLMYSFLHTQTFKSCLRPWARHLILMLKVLVQIAFSHPTFFQTPTDFDIRNERSYFSHTYTYQHFTFQFGLVLAKLLKESQINAKSC